MRVLLVSDVYSHPERAISATFRHRQAVEAAKLGLEIRVLCPLPLTPRQLGNGSQARPSAGELDLDGIRVSRVNYPQLLPFGAAARLGGFLLERALHRHASRIRKDFKFDLIHGIRLFPMVSALVSVAEATKSPLVGMAVGSDVHTHPYRSRGIRRLTRRAIRGSDRLIAVSRALAESVLELGQPACPIATVYNGVDTDMFSPDPARRRDLRAMLGLPEASPGLCMVTRLVRTKGLRELVDAFGRITEEIPDAWLAIVGDGPDRSLLEDWVGAAGLRGRVFVPGAQPHEAVPRWLNASDVFILPSYNEGLPNVVLEAMACGLPVVSTDVGGTGEAVLQGETGFLVPPRSSDSLLEPLRALLRDESLRERFGRAARSRACEVFGWSQSARALVRVYEAVLERGRAPGATGFHKMLREVTRE